MNITEICLLSRGENVPPGTIMIVLHCYASQRYHMNHESRSLFEALSAGRMGTGPTYEGDAKTNWCGSSSEHPRRT